MMKKFINSAKYMALGIFCTLGLAVVAQTNGTLEMTSLSSNNVPQGPSLAPVVVDFRHDIQNLTFGTVFQQNTPQLLMTTNFRNQQYTGLTLGDMTTGMTFGAGTSSSTGGIVQEPLPYYIYTAFGATLVQPPQNGMFITSPSATPVANYQANGFGVGMDPEATQNGTDGGNFDYNFGMAVYTTVEPLFRNGSAKDGRFYYGDLVFTFSRPVINPVLHVGGLGGSYTFQPIGGGPRQISYFTSELELQNSGVTSTFMAGNENLNVSGNNILNSSTNPNGGSYDDGTTLNGFSTYGAATGSVRLNGTFTEIVYKVYVKGSPNSDFNFSKDQADILGADRNPVNGDLFYVAFSLDKPTQQISGSVFNDADGLTDNNINTSAAVANPKTNAGGLFANLLNSAGDVVAVTAVSPEGVYLFDNVTPGTYTVQLTTNAGTVGSVAPATQLPTGWANTGENGSTSPGNVAGDDGTIDGQSAQIVVSLTDVKAEVNFGIERLPESVDFTTIVPKPVVGTVYTLNNTGPNLFPILSGSDPEDMPTSGILTGKSVQISTLPTNSTLRYNGVAVTTGQIIENFDPSLLQILITSSTVGSTSTEFTYAYVDAAGKPDPVPNTYTIDWQGVLPVTLSSFTANGINCTAVLNFKTTSELNTDRFEIEVSTNAGNVYAKATSITAAGNSTTERNYSYNFAMQTGYTYLFRLKLVDKDGNFSYSNVQKVSCDGKILITLSPNPVKGQFFLQGLSTGKNIIAVYTASGQRVVNEIISAQQGYVDVSTLKAGMYLVRIVDQDGKATSLQIIKD